MTAMVHPKDDVARHRGRTSPLTFPVVVVAVLCVVAPLLWVVVVQLVGPDDGTSIGPSFSLGGTAHWTRGLTIDGVDPPGSLLAGDVVTAVDGAPVADLSSSPPRHIGDVLIYQVMRGNATLQIPVRLTGFPTWHRIIAAWNVFLVAAVLYPCAVFVFLRRPKDPAARLMLALAALMTAGIAAAPLGLRVVDLVGGRGVWPAVVSDIANTLMWAALVHFALVLPEPSRLVIGRPWRILLIYAFPFVLYAGGLILTLPTAAPALARLEQVIAVSDEAARALPLVVVVLLVLAYRRSPDRATRQRMSWVIATLAGASLVYVGLGQVPEMVVGHPLVADAWLQLVFISCPVAMVAAILRYQLFDIELILKRSLVYATLASVLIGAYLVTLFALSKWFPDHSQFIALVAGSAVALALRPVHDRLQRRVNRLVYGARDDPYEVVSRLTRLDPAVQSWASLSQLTDTLVTTLRLSYAAIEWTRSDGTSEIAAHTGVAYGHLESLPLRRGGEVLGHLLLAVKEGREAFGPADRRLLEDVTTQVSRVTDVVLLNAALQRSRERLVTAREEERRRLHRDLHDGIGPSLAAQAMQLDVARATLRSDPDSTDTVLAAIVRSTQGLITEVRRVVDDLRPRALDQLGLVSAVREKASAFNAGCLGPGPGYGFAVSVDARGDFTGLPAATEVAAYRIATEALTNAARHGGATAAHITLAADEAALTVAVSDDGCGISANYRPGVGINSMTERANELGGSLTISTSAAEGTTLTARLPLSREPLAS